MYANQDRMIFPGAYMSKPTAVGPSEPGVEQVWITTADGERVEAWYRAGRGRSASSPGPALMYFHGNADLVDTTWAGMRGYLDRGISTLVMEYRGYGRSGGRPSEAGLLADATEFYCWVQARPEVDSRRIIFQGLSLGGGVAAALSERHAPAALILECTFTSLASMAHRYLLPGALCRNQFRTDSVIRHLDLPVLIMHGRRDNTIPVAHGRRLHELARGSRYVELDCGHNDYRNDWSAIVGFLRDNALMPE